MFEHMVYVVPPDAVKAPQASEPPAGGSLWPESWQGRLLLVGACVAYLLLLGALLIRSVEMAAAGGAAGSAAAGRAGTCVPHRTASVPTPDALFGSSVGGSSLPSLFRAAGPRQ